MSDDCDGLCSCCGRFSGDLVDGFCADCYGSDGVPEDHYQERDPDRWRERHWED